jgi:hypothetical protein
LGDRIGALIFFAPLSPALDLAQTVIQRVDERIATAGIIKQVILQIGITTNNPNIPKHFVQHARGTTGLPCGAQAGQQVPRAITKQPDDDLAVGEGCVVVRDLAQARRLGAFRRVSQQGGKVRWGVHSGKSGA